ncbi:MAG: membrane protein insertase YidC [Nitrospinae bacterium]|nr:membrane protein insertase YidC [Nitrospinota bacterium]
MENRALLAFILSLLIFIGWGYFLSVVQPPPKERIKPPARESQISGETAQPSASPEPQAALTAPGAASTMETAPPAPRFAGTEKKIKVTTGLATFVVSNQGATIEDILLKKYPEKNGEATNLVHKVKGAKAPLTLEASVPEVSEILREAYYEASADSLDLSESNPSAKLTLRLKHESGLEAFREFTFHYNQYIVDVRTEVNAPAFAGQNVRYMSLWGPGLGGETDGSQMFIHTGPTVFVNNDRLEIKEDDVVDVVRHQGDLEWVAFQNKYFAAALVPGQGVKAGAVKKENGSLYVGMEFESVQSSASASFSLYAGTKELLVLESMGHKLVRLIDYGWLGNKFAFLVKPLLRVLQYFYDKTANYGWSIIVLTFIIKLVFFPLTHKSFKSMKGMQKIQPYVKVIQERNKNDRQKMNEELIELYKKHRVNPLGGCLPMLLQIPVFISLYHALFFSIELRGAPFLWWIKDLSSSDPYYITPILMGATMFLQQKMTPSVGDPVQQKIMLFLPVVFTFMFISFPAGLVIYWTVNNILTIAQQYYIYKLTKD